MVYEIIEPSQTKNCEDETKCIHFKTHLKKRFASVPPEDGARLSLIK